MDPGTRMSRVQTMQISERTYRSVDVSNIKESIPQIMVPMRTMGVMM